MVSYLTDRKQLTVVNGIKSKLGMITHGVPQGSILGPLLLLVHINDIVNAIPNPKQKLFADDTSLFVHDRGMEKLTEKTNSHIENLSKWFVANKLSLNESKTCYSIFTNKTITTEFEFKINNKIINRVPHCK